ncbi:NAD(P)-dependent dehydrogenase (short-subunit alcohol dehydrogenase family) [Aminobacter aminovorans]|uniref:3-oxoacyl-[acyl-carrier-protein] reductase FabG n=1 Tax=Aminobacter aminovorans TaxID=83263 RepID=A0A380WI19_AMIAI|nr:3-ketoacyl-ACP reductase [Aminobacter aminovorans]TCS28716.1 NAD(P)-dependent dehydrogenase (short-subunit alcohol dehydrogenase family) [Aminobacter aminovorans]SUU88570.1 3-oxoacyl-[acyl-carrier-protein] reductase FabG [Aminobacter aminovorans]
MKAPVKPVALVTGARRGIGLATAEALARAGFDLAITDREEDAASAEAVSGLEKHGARVLFVASDLADLDGHAGTVDKIVGHFGQIDCLVNNAGVASRVRGDFLELTPENFNAIMAVNLRGTVFFTQAVLRAMLVAPPTLHPRSVINITSISAEMTSPDRLDYCMSKAGLAAFTQGLTLRLAGTGIDVFEIRPGIIRSDMTAKASEKYDRLIADGLVPVKRWGEPDDIGRIAAALAGGGFGFATGSIIRADGALSVARL